jgi:hypothetical protein
MTRSHPARRFRRAASPATLAALATAVVLAAIAPSARAQAPARPNCEADSLFHALDFWVGSWNVYEGDALDGRDVVTKTLGGCAVTEDWTGHDGSRGFSLFYVEPVGRRWKQVWVTEQALAPGGLKEKHLIARLPDGGVRFQGELRLPNGRWFFDRTTLHPLAGGEVRQVIEISTDGGDTWRTTYDARYRKAP